MAKVNNHKMALLYMMRELLLKTDEEHVLNATDLIRALENMDLEADRRTIYSNVEILQDFGIDVIKKENGQGYYIGSRDFELPELKLLVDSVQSSKFITEKKSRELIGKLMRLTNEQKARQLNRAVFIRNRMKTGNESVYYNVDALHEAMNLNRQIEFKYGEWNTGKKLVEKKGGRKYLVSPWALTWDDENYYLIAFDEAAGIIKHYRVDKMMKIDLTERERVGQEAFQDFDLAAFSVLQKDLRHVRRARCGCGAPLQERTGRRHHRPLRHRDFDRAGRRRVLSRACHSRGESAVLRMGDRHRSGDRDQLAPGGAQRLQGISAGDPVKILKFLIFGGLVHLLFDLVYVQVKK